LASKAAAARTAQERLNDDLHPFKIKAGMAAMILWSFRQKYS